MNPFEDMIAARLKEELNEQVTNLRHTMAAKREIVASIVQLYIYYRKRGSNEAEAVEMAVHDYEKLNDAVFAMMERHDKRAAEEIERELKKQE